MVKDDKLTGKCEKCGKNKAVAFMNKKKLCERCWIFIKQGNEHLIGL